MKNFILLLVVMSFATTINAQEIFRTQTIGGWGSTPEGANPGSYLHENFEALAIRGEGGVTIGYGENTVTFTSAEAISAFLPSSGKSSSLTESLIDPTKRDLRNTFASQVLALSISVMFDQVDADFGESSYELAKMSITDGAMAGLTVEEALLEANKLLGGAESVYTISEANQTISRINEAYIDGQVRDASMLTVSSKTLETNATQVESTNATQVLTPDRDLQTQQVETIDVLIKP